MSKRKKKLQAELGTFLKQYARKASPGHDPNDRRYNRDIEAQVKRMTPEELEALLDGDDDEDAPNQGPTSLGV